MEIHEIVEKLIGPINPVGETNADDKRFENLKTLCTVVNELVTDIDNVAYHYKDSQEYSVKRAVDYAKNFMTNTLGITE